MSETLETESNLCQSNKKINEEVDEDDDVILICDQHQIIEIEDTDDESNGTSNNNQTFLSAPRILKDKIIKTEEIKTRTIHSKKQIQHVGDEEVIRIPLKKHNIELICKHFGIDYNPEWSLQQIRNTIKERTKKYKQTPELLEAISRNHKPLNWCRGLYVSCLPDWFKHIHIVTLISLMSKFDINKLTYWIVMDNQLKKISSIDPEDVNTGGCAIRFVEIEDCRQVFLDMQGIQCFNNNIKVRIDFGMYYKKFKLGRTRKVLEHIKLFRRQMKNWCSEDDGGIEIDDSDEETSKSYSFPRLLDIQKNFKRRCDPEEELNMPVDQTGTLFVNKDREDSPSSKNDEENKVAPYSKIEEASSTVVMDRIPNTWGNLVINNFIRNATGQGIQFVSRKLTENNDNTIKYLLKFPTHQIAEKICHQLNGIVVNNKKIEVNLELGNDDTEDIQSKDSNLRAKINQTQSNTEIVPASTTGATVQDPSKSCSFPQMVVDQDKLKQTSNPEKEHKPDETDKIESNPETCLFYEDRDGTTSSKNDEKNLVAPHSEEGSCIVVMDKIPNMWGNLVINNFIRDAAGQDVQFISRKLIENNDNTMKYVFKFPTNQIAVNVYRELNGTILPGKKKIDAKLDFARVYNDEFKSEDSKLYTVKRKLVSDKPPEPSEPKTKKKKRKIIARVISAAASADVFSMQNMATGATIMNMLVEPEGSAIQQAALLYENPPRFNNNSNFPSNQHSYVAPNAQNLRQQIAPIMKKNEQLSFLNRGIFKAGESDNKNSTNTIKPSQSIVGNLGKEPIQDTNSKEMQSQDDVKPEKQDSDTHGKQALLKCHVDDEMLGKQDMVIKKEVAELVNNSQNERFQQECNEVGQNILEKKRAFSRDNNFSTFSSSSGCKERSDMLIFKNLPRSVSNEALASKLCEVGEVLFCEQTAAGRAVVRLKDPRDAERCAYFIVPKWTGKSSRSP